jgi:ABC-type glycerol-3-phosphate transport system permease component
MARCNMNRWLAITEIVKSFNEKDRPWHALAALLMITVVPIVALLYAAGTNIAPFLMR